MKLPNPHCPHCGRTTGIVIKECNREDLVSVYCASCRLTTLIQAHDDSRCPECRAERNNHIDGCEAAG